MTTVNSTLNWEDLDLPMYEDPAETRVRLEAIHRSILQQKNIATRPDKNSPGFSPTEYQSRQVAVMAALGLDPKDIALVLNVEEKLLKMYYGKELRISHNLANAMVSRQALKMAMSGKYPDMTKFWLKSRAGWTEKVAAPQSDAPDREGIDSAKDRLKRAISTHTPKPGQQ